MSQTSRPLTTIEELEGMQPRFPLSPTAVELSRQIVPAALADDWDLVDRTMDLLLHVGRIDFEQHHGVVLAGEALDRYEMWLSDETL